MKLKYVIAIFSILAMISNIYAQELISSDSASSATITRTLEFEEKEIFSAAISPDGNLVAINDGAAEQVLVVESSSGDTLLEIPYIEDDQAFFLTFNADSSQLIILWFAGNTSFYDIETGEATEGIPFEFPVDFVAERGLYLGLDAETQTPMLSVRDGETSIAEFALPDFTLYFPIFNADASMLVVALGGDVYLLDIEADEELGEAIVTLEVEALGITAFAISPDNSLLAVSNGDTYVTTVYDVETGEEVFSIDGSGTFSPLDMLRFSPDGTVLYGTNYNKIELYDAATGDLLNTLELPSGERVAALELSEDGSTVIVLHNTGISTIAVSE